MVSFNRWIAKVVLRIPGVMSQLVASAQAKAWTLTVACILCKEQIVMDAEYCTYCGIWQKDDNTPSLAQPEQDTEPLCRTIPALPHIDQESTHRLPTVKGELLYRYLQDEKAKRGVGQK